ncbi:6-hydroxynicotinate 3-monooxygenase [Colletotrichum higginsianum]|uniref:6-hydroxynicotinate 3-monooxygenase n=1 Tax=Colletotrichum higginsianum TaxID=80884 RepID=A0A4T0VK44_9PEZI|nr:6-hydroxynicotinate 3-monooxygenase [Colletotrichum higginsianum]
MTIRDGSLHESNEIPQTTVSGTRDSGGKLRIGIVGAGIGGLMAAVALLESGHDVEIYEKSRFKSEVGAAICTPPNSSRILAHYGFDFEQARATTSEDSIYFTDPSDLGQKRVVPCADFTPKYGAPFCFFHRVDLHSELRRLATEPTDKRPRSARLHLGTSVTGVDDDGTLWFEDGTSVRKDLVVAADGIRSAFVSRVVEEAPRAQHHMSIMRYLVPSETVLADPEVAGFFVDGLKSLRVVDNVDKRVIIYGCRGGSLQNIGLIYPPRLGMDAAGNDISESEGFASKVMAEFPETIQSICREAKDVGQWQLFTRAPLERLARGRVVLIGDAAHPMPPLRAQGASMAIEDAAALGVLLSQVESADEVPARMDMFNKLRWCRVAATQLLSSEHRWDPSQLSAEQRGYFSGDVPHTEDDVEKYSYEYDVIRDALELLKEDR